MFDNILVTGANGFVGQALVPALDAAFPAARIHAAGSVSTTSKLGCNLSDTDSVKQLIDQVQPDAVINLAAISHIPTSFDKPAETWQVNLQGPLNLLDAISATKQPCTFIQVGSGDCYGDSFKSGDAVTEATAFMPMNPYAASKAAADIAVYSYRNRQGLKIIRARPFNHTAAGQSNQFVLSAFAEQVARIEAGVQPATMQVGNLEAARCFLHVDDVIDAYIKLLQHSDTIESGSAFNIVSDAPVTIQSLLQQLINSSDVEISVETDPARLRPSDIPVARGDASALKQQTGWQASTDLQAIVNDVLGFWRNHYQQDS